MSRCSTDINILAHPHYDIYHDLAIVHWHAFKIPDNAQLRFQCAFEICLEIADSDTGLSGCDEIVTVEYSNRLLCVIQPPYCPDIVSAAPGQLLFAPKFEETNFVARSQHDGLGLSFNKSAVNQSTNQSINKSVSQSIFADVHVGAAVCVDDEDSNGPPLCIDFAGNEFEMGAGRRASINQCINESIQIRKPLVSAFRRTVSLARVVCACIE